MIHDNRRSYKRYARDPSTFTLNLKNYISFIITHASLNGKTMTTELHMLESQITTF